MRHNPLIATLQRIADALDRLSPAVAPLADLKSADAFVWSHVHHQLHPVVSTDHQPLDILQGVDYSRDILLKNTFRFAKGLPANNVLLWGARGMGKSSLVKAIHAHINHQQPHAIALIEVERDELSSLPTLLRQLANSTRRIILFCDDLSFEMQDSGYKALKSVLEGGISGRPKNVLLYATSNRQHLVPRDIIENEQGTAIHPGEAVEEKVSLSDRFGLSLGFYGCDEETFLAMIDAYANHYRIRTAKAELHAQAKEWAITRGSRSGRVAYQFMQTLITKRA